MIRGADAIRDRAVAAGWDVDGDVWRGTRKPSRGNTPIPVASLRMEKDVEDVGRVRLVAHWSRGRFECALLAVTGYARAYYVTTMPKLRAVVDDEHAGFVTKNERQVSLNGTAPGSDAVGRLVSLTASDQLA